MPLYEYRAIEPDDGCDRCSSAYEVLQRIKDDELSECDACGRPVERLLSRSSFQLKGGGWYADSYQKS